jgi:hypothetical protein
VKAGRPLPRHRRTATGGAEGNERLTAMTGAVLLLLLAVEGVTIVFRRELLTLHFFIGFLLAGPVLLKVSTTGYRFARYYTGSAPYVRKGPPAPLLRLLGPVVIVTSAGVIGSGIGLALDGPQPLLMLAHKAFFVLWLGAMTIHVLWYAPRLPRLLSSRMAAPAGARLTLAGSRSRWLVLAAALGAGLMFALATYHTAGTWTSVTGHGGG